MQPSTPAVVATIADREAPHSERPCPNDLHVLTRQIAPLSRRGVPWSDPEQTAQSRVSMFPQRQRSRPRRNKTCATRHTILVSGRSRGSVRAGLASSETSGARCSQIRAEFLHDSVAALLRAPVRLPPSSETNPLPHSPVVAHQSAAVARTSPVAGSCFSSSHTTCSPSWFSRSPSFSA